MNILPKKRWHVRTKDNIARVRRDEAQAAEEEKEKERRIKLAEKEARRDLMRARARMKYDGSEAPSKEECAEDRRVEAASSTQGHINFFEEEEAGLVSSDAVNKEHEEEKKQEREKYEKQIGYLTYLGQDTNEATGKVSWYNKCPEREEPGLTGKEEMGLKHKHLSDPLNAFRKYCIGVSKTSHSSSVGPAPLASQTSVSVKRRKERSRTPDNETKSKRQKLKKKKHKKEKKHKSRRAFQDSPDRSSDSDSGSDSPDEDELEKKKKLEKLRADRLRREKEEKKKADKLMAKLNGVAYIDEDDKPQPKPIMKQRYNSQFNPEIAKQNYDDQKYRF